MSRMAATLVAGLLSTAILPFTGTASQIEQRPYVTEPAVPTVIRNGTGWKTYVICEDGFCTSSGKGLKKAQPGNHRDLLMTVRLSQDLPPETVVSKPVLALPPPVASGQEETKTPMYTVLFPFNSAVVETEEKAGLLRGVRRLFSPVSIEGFSCDLGEKSYNDDLALRRAKNVARALKEEGIEVGMVWAEGKCCYVSEERRLNRRVEVRSAEKSKGGR